MAILKIPVVIDGVKNIEELANRVLDEYEYHGRTIREYVPCRRNDDGAEGFICPETGDFICIRPSEEGE